MLNLVTSQFVNGINGAYLKIYENDIDDIYLTTYIVHDDKNINLLTLTQPFYHHFLSDVKIFYPKNHLSEYNFCKKYAIIIFIACLIKGYIFNEDIFTEKTESRTKIVNYKFANAARSMFDEFKAKQKSIQIKYKIPDFQKSIQIDIVSAIFYILKLLPGHTPIYILKLKKGQSLPECNEDKHKIDIKKLNIDETPLMPSVFGGTYNPYEKDKNFIREYILSKIKEAAEAKRLADVEAEAKRLADETEVKRLAAEAEAKRLADDEAEAKRLAAEAEDKRLADVEAEAKRLADEAEAKRLANVEAEAKKLLEKFRPPKEELPQAPKDLVVVPQNRKKNKFNSRASFFQNGKNTT